MLAAEKDAVSGGAKVSGRVPQETPYIGELQLDYCWRLVKIAGVYNQKADDNIETNKVRATNSLHPLHDSSMILLNGPAH